LIKTEADPWQLLEADLEKDDPLTLERYRQIFLLIAAPYMVSYNSLHQSPVMLLGFLPQHNSLSQPIIPLFSPPQCVAGRSFSIITKWEKKQCFLI
jgi:hypothetical protein